MLYIWYESYKGGTNNLTVVMDEKGIVATRTRGAEQAIKNYNRKMRKGI